mmetsp:Transcript_40840/g.122057  ORF Transcript_40840/g.122057 Transcript_40840/m.122057 type:complete len:83 (-) Transcript_40840:622-870(-)
MLRRKVQTPSKAKQARTSKQFRRSLLQAGQSMFFQKMSVGAGASWILIAAPENRSLLACKARAIRERLKRYSLSRTKLRWTW